MSSIEFNGKERRALRKLARRAIVHGLQSRQGLAIRVADYPPKLQAERASFITLQLHGELRGCIGHLEAQQPLVNDIAENAFSAAFADPRFDPLTFAELEDIDIVVSVLSEPQPLSFSDQQDLIDQLQPGIDGLILETPQGHRGTFLPSVWSSLPEPEQFLVHLKQKAGLPADYWADDLKVSRYTTESF
jgi:uncharacterized protein